jgi:hypothetical protein
MQPKIVSKHLHPTAKSHTPLLTNKPTSQASHPPNANPVVTQPPKSTLSKLQAPPQSSLIITSSLGVPASNIPYTVPVKSPGLHLINKSAPKSPSSSLGIPISVQSSLLKPAGIHPPKLVYSQHAVPVGKKGAPPVDL